MVNLTPAQLPVGSPTDTSVVHSSENNEVDNSKGHNERDISRLQGTAPDYSNEKTYALNDLITEGDHVYRNITAITTGENFNPAKWLQVGAAGAIANISAFDIDTAYSVGDLVVFETIQRRCVNPVAGVGAAFDPDDWTAADSIGVKNVVTVYDQKDFGDIISGGRVELTTETAYLIGGSLQIDNPLFAPTGSRIKFLGLGGFTDTITNNTIGGTLVITDLGKGNFTGASSAAGGLETEYTGATLHGMLIGENVQVLGTINQGTFTITAATANTFTVDNGFGGNETGTFNQGVFEVQFDGVIVSGGQEVFNGLFLDTSDTRCEFRNVITSGTDSLGTIDFAETLVIENYDVSATAASLQIIDCKDVLIQNVIGQSFIGSVDFFRFTGSTTNFVNISNCILNMPDNFSIFHFPSGGTNPVNTDLEFHIHDCKDTNPVNKDDLFDSANSGLDENSSDAFVHDNGIHPGSVVFAQARFDVSDASSAIVDITDNAPTQIVDIAATKKWELEGGQRFSINVDNGTLTYIGGKTVDVLLNYVAGMDTSNADQLFLVLDSGSQISDSRIDVDSNSLRVNLSGSFIINMKTDDTIQLRCGNAAATNNITFTHCILDIIEIG